MKGGGAPPPGGLEDVVSLSQAINQGLVTVTERGTTSFDNVHWLRFNTHSDKSVFIGGGEIMAGGRQDRMVIRDTILHPSPKDQYVPVMCVEEGRWSEKEKKFAYGNFANADLRKVLDLYVKNQVSVWREVDRQLQAGAFKKQKQKPIYPATKTKNTLRARLNILIFSIRNSCIPIVPSWVLSPSPAIR